MSDKADDLESNDSRPSRPGKILPFPPPRAVPDWLTGPADGLDAALDPLDDASDEAPPETLPRPILKRFGVPVESPGLVTNAEPGVVEAEIGKAQESEVVDAPARTRRVAQPGIWAPVASSVPSLRQELPAEPGPPEDASAPPAPARFRGAPGHGHDEDLPRVTAVPPPLAELREAWWVIAIDGLRTSRSAQLGVAVGCVAFVMLAWWAWPRGVGTTSLSELRSHPSQFDGRAVTVRGRAGDDIFEVGAGWAFYLVQGRDTIVTFTRSQMPKPHDVITVKGQVSTGFLDGVPRQALFEDVAGTQ